jgi:pyruvate/2-oxoglutarate dehydrogenase complex dihydrolipoamide acyltransferase (E2) component
MSETSRPPSSGQPEDRIESIPLGWRWIDDAFAVSPTAAGFGLLMADMTKAKAALRLLRDARIPATMTHLIVRATALALARNPECHQMVVNYKRLSPGTVDIGLSMAGETTYAPVVVLAAADQKPLSTLIPFIIESIDNAAEKERIDLAAMRRQLWVIPFGFMRRFILRWLNKWIWFRRRIAGTFQVSTVPNIDVVGPLMFYTSCGIAAGSVADRVVAVGGQAVVRPTMWLTVAGDHAAVDGVRAARLLCAVRDTLESDELLTEAREACEARLASTKGGERALPESSGTSRVVPAPTAESVAK